MQIYSLITSLLFNSCLPRAIPSWLPKIPRISSKKDANKTQEIFQQCYILFFSKNGRFQILEQHDPGKWSTNLWLEISVKLDWPHFMYTSEKTPDFMNITDRKSQRDFCCATVTGVINNITNNKYVDSFSVLFAISMRIAHIKYILLLSVLCAIDMIVNWVHTNIMQLRNISGQYLGSNFLELL